jgi:DNA repair exonuclease SbcCD ATPase subunit
LRRLDGSNCPTCGAERVDAAHVERHNAGVAQKEAALLAHAKGVEGSAEEFVAYSSALKGALTVDKGIEMALAKWPENLDQPVVDAARTPRTVTLPAEPVAEPVDVLRRRVSEITRECIRQEEAQGALDRAERQISFTHLDLTSTESILATATLPDLQQSKESLATARASLDALTVCLRDVSTQVSNAKVEASTLRARGEAAVSALAQAEQRITDIRADLEALAFGNGLMDKLRKLKPAVTDHLWSLTLTAVSAFFTQIRGEDSIVTKDSSGFCINGEPLSSYSGSTKDALAIAIRVALTKTFLPAAPFVTLDEPAHGASDERTGRILGFLASAGIDQVVIASHDPLSESVADNLIYL